MLRRRSKLRIETERMILRLPQHGDFAAWANLRRESASFLQPWEPAWSTDHLSRKAFVHRVHWAHRAALDGSAMPLFLIGRDETFYGALTLDNIRRGPAQAGTLGYWIGERHHRQGLMREAIEAVVHYAFTNLEVSRLEAACLPENVASRGVLERSGFKYEGVAQSYLQINGRWRNHVLYACLRTDRRGKTVVGLE
ncbi:GNAT family N-acetyltransferase [Brevirhabdus pacifica]|uniref:GNAT family N-acetyltransferase n=1 Tax=Brevirhabdus pacifica TaxID=1267768 RepID=A0A1U7DHK4_9RHOB|nr:GNAT family protein [Brevirhabdus pacifica]APX89358.1 GNAT family N-acetyltransferase [Brevirhabdus pacifica]OWU76617.1 GCN5 family acetyltransferase [Loktanella sp. 22II-4b]PJJ86014.1 ribosomal-protein-alanine N-acetyltransferase [Brevirhabdus pacifica]